MAASYCSPGRVAGAVCGATLERAESFRRLFLRNDAAAVLEWRQILASASPGWKAYLYPPRCFTHMLKQVVKRISGRMIVFPTGTDRM